MKITAAIRASTPWTRASITAAILQRLVGLIDGVSISLNEADAKIWTRCKPLREDSSLYAQFAGIASNTALRQRFRWGGCNQPEDIETCRRIAEDIGADFGCVIISLRCCKLPKKNSVPVWTEFFKKRISKVCWRIRPFLIRSSGRDAFKTETFYSSRPAKHKIIQVFKSILFGNIGSIIMVNCIENNQNKSITCLREAGTGLLIARKRKIACLT